MPKANTIARSLFGLFLFFSLTTPSWRYGPFSWWPIWTQERFAGGPIQVGILNLLPLFALLFLIFQVFRARSWSWGPRFATVPLILYSLWAMVRLLGAPERYLFIYGGGLLLAWFVYLVVVNDRPPLRSILGLVLIVQGLTGTLQFLLQRDLGLIWLGELPLNPAFEGNSVIQARGEPWLRAYGLTAHPNLYGALLALSILLVAVTGPGAPPRGAWLRSLSITFGAIGLFFSFSRSAWLATVIALLFWLVLRLRQGWRPSRQSMAWIALLGLLLIMIGHAYGELALNRFTNLQDPLEARSINQRFSDARAAVHIGLEHPVLGVGYGRYVDAATQIDVSAERVHNVLLLTFAELGLPGLVLVVSLLLGPLLTFVHTSGHGKMALARATTGLAPWLVVLVVNQLDTTLWLGGNWQTAMLFALAAGHTARHLITPATAQRFPRKVSEVNDHNE